MYNLIVFTQFEVNIIAIKLAGCNLWSTPGVSLGPLLFIV